MRVKKGDTVEIITGKNRTERGEVERTHPQDHTVVITGKNIVTRHQRSVAGRPAGLIEKPAPIHVSNVMVVCPGCDLKTRVGYQEKDGKKIRICKKCGKEIKG